MVQGMVGDEDQTVVRMRLYRFLLGFYVFDRIQGACPTQGICGNRRNQRNNAVDLTSRGGNRHTAIASSY
jgi:hypothetical protein